MQLKNKLPEQLMGNDILWLISLERNLELKEETVCLSPETTKTNSKECYRAVSWLALARRDQLHQRKINCADLHQRKR